MKVVLLLIAIYALIINQSLKQVDSKQAKQEVRKDIKTNQSQYTNASFVPVTPFAIEADVMPAAMDIKNPVQPAYLLQPEVSYPGTDKPRNALYPLNYPHPARLDKKRS